jgi:hypothetical protein
MKVDVSQLTEHCAFVKRCMWFSYHKISWLVMEKSAGGGLTVTSRSE